MAGDLRKVYLSPTEQAAIPQNSVIRQLLENTVVGAPRLARSQIPSTPIPTSTILLDGFTTVGDAGAGALYSSVSATSGGLMAIQDANSKWWNLVPRGAAGVGAVGGTAHIGWFGAACDQATDDTAAVQKGVNWAIKNQGNIVLENNLITSGVTFTSTGGSNLLWTIRGTGQGASLIANSPAFSLLTLDVGSAGSFQDWVLKDLHFDNTGSVGGTGLTITGSGSNQGISQFLFDNLLFSNFTTGLLQSNPLGWNWGVVNNIRIFNCTNGINLSHSGGTGNNYTNITAQMASTSTGIGINCGDGIQNMGDQNWVSINGDGGNIGMLITGGTNYGDYNIVDAFHWDGPNTWALQLVNTHHAHVYGNFTNAPVSVDITSSDTDLNNNDTNKPAQITSSQNDYSVGNTEVRYAFINSNGAVNITGITNGYDGKRLDLFNNGSNTISLVSSSTSSLAGNRFSLGATVALAGGTGISLRYSTATTTNGTWIRVGGQ